MHPLDQFRAMQQLVEQGTDIETIAANFMVTPAVVKQRLRLASVSPKLHEVYAEDGMTHEQLIAFAVSEDHERQDQVWEQLKDSYQNEACYTLIAAVTDDEGIITGVHRTWIDAANLDKAPVATPRRTRCRSAATTR